MTATLTRQHLAFRVEPKPFAATVAWAVNALPSRPTVPTLACVKVVVADGVLTLSAFDYDVSATATVDVIGDQPGEALVSGRLLSKLAETFPNKPVDARIAGQELLLVCGGASAALPLLPVEEYPSLPELPPTVGTVDAVAFARAVKRTASCAGDESTGLAVLMGAYLRFAERVEVITSDRYRIAVDSVPWVRAADQTVEVLAPATTLAKLAPAVAALGADLGVSADDTAFGLSAPGRTIVMRQLAEKHKFPAANYARILPPRSSTPVTVPCADLVDAVKRAELVHEKTTPILLAFTTGEVRVSASGEGKADTVVDCTYDGEPITVAVNPMFMRDVLAAAGTDLELSFTDPRKAFLACSGDADDPYRYIAMPIRQS